jgi:protein-arginine kinase activator protein McsA
MISTFNNNKNKIETYNVCDDCVTNISSKLQEVEITDYEEMIYVKNILHMSKK